MGLEELIESVKMLMLDRGQADPAFKGLQEKLEELAPLYRMMIDITNIVPKEHYDRLRNFLNDNYSNIESIHNFVWDRTFNDVKYDGLFNILENDDDIPASLEMLDKVDKFVHGSETVELIEEFFEKQVGKKGAREVLGAIVRNAKDHDNNTIQRYCKFSADNMDVFELYNDKEAVASMLYRIQEKTVVEGMNKVKKALMNPTVVKALHNADRHEDTFFYLGNIARYATPEDAIESAKLMERMPSFKAFKFAHLVYRAAANYKDAEVVKQLNTVFEKFEKYSRQIIDIFDAQDHKYSRIYFQELLNENAYKYVNKSTHPGMALHRLLTHPYLWQREGYPEDIRQKIGYRDMDRVTDLEDFIREVHAERNHLDVEKIIDGYRNELDRAMDQADDFKGKIRNLRQYCREVEQQIRNNIEDLMVVTDGS